MTTLYVYFGELTVIRYRRDIFMSWDGLFASFGGIFSLCLGGSVLCLVEVGYFFTIRLAMNCFGRTVAMRKIKEQKKKKKQRKFQGSDHRIGSGTATEKSNDNLLFGGFGKKRRANEVV